MPKGWRCVGVLQSLNNGQLITNLNLHARHGMTSGSTDLADSGSTLTHSPILSDLFQNGVTPDTNVALKIIPSLIGTIDNSDGVELELESEPNLGSLLPVSEILYQSVWLAKFRVECGDLSKGTL
jgi:hypothetical protein